MGGRVGSSHLASCAALAFTPEGRALVVAYGGATAAHYRLAQFDWPGGREVASWDLPHRPWAIAPGPSGERVLVTGDEGLAILEELVR